MNGLPQNSRGGPSPPDLEMAPLTDRGPPDSNPVSHWLHGARPADGPGLDRDALAGLAPALVAAGATRIKTKAAAPKSFAAAQRKWLMMDASGDTEMVILNKYDLTHLMGVQLRDMRLLDPQLAASYPSAILCRERALVVNLEYIKMIVGLDRCYITNLDDENTAAFVSELQRRLSAVAAGMPPTKSAMDLTAAERAGKADGGAGLDELPFELRVLECALDLVSAYLSRLTTDLEAAAHPALDALTLRVTKGGLERVRRVKNRMVRLTTRVETLREVLEKLLDDDSDMRDMNLSARRAREEADALRQGSGAGAGAQPFDVLLNATGTKTPGTPHSAMTYDSEEEDKEAAETVEQLLESYFMQVDNTWNKLQALAEYVDDTEDYINIQLDSKRNDLIRVDLILTCFAASVGMITAITSLFAMNTQLYPGNTDKAPYAWFVVISAVSAFMSVALFVGVMSYARSRKII